MGSRFVKYARAIVASMIERCTPGRSSLASKSRPLKSAAPVAFT